MKQLDVTDMPLSLADSLMHSEYAQPTHLSFRGCREIADNSAIARSRKSPVNIQLEPLDIPKKPMTFDKDMELETPSTCAPTSPPASSKTPSFEGALQRLQYLPRLQYLQDLNR